MEEEEIRKIAQEAAGAAVEALAKDIKRVPVGGEDPPPSEPEFKSFGEFLRAVNDIHKQQMRADDPRMSVMKALSEGTDSAGGFLVPEQFAAGIEQIALEEAIVRPRARKMPMATDTLNYPTVKSTSHASSVHGGVIAYWLEEAGTKTESQPTFGNIKLIAKKLIGFTYASDELLEDAAIALEALLNQQFGSALTWFEEEAFWQGTGAGQPLGIFNSSAVVTVARQTDSQVGLTDLGNLMSRFLGNLYGPGVIWVANKSVLPQLMALGSTYVTWQKIAGEKVPGGLFGIPLAFSEHVPTLNTTGDIGLYDLSKYIIGDRKGLTIARSVEYRFVNDETTWRFVKRLDGQPVIDSALTPKRGNSQSYFVQLTDD